MRPDYDYSMWPEHARPRGRRISLKFLAGAFTAGVVCTIAASMVFSEFVKAPSLSTSPSVGRSWPLTSAADGSSAALGPTGNALTKTGDSPPDAATSAEPGCDPQKSPYGIDPCPRTSQRETTGSAPSARPAKPARTLSQQATLPRIGAQAAAREEVESKPAEPAPPAAGRPEEQATSLRKELDTAASEEAKPQDKPKPRKKARRKQERPGEEPGTTARVYDLPDGRRITVIRRGAEAPDYGRPAPGYYARPGYHQY